MSSPPTPLLETDTTLLPTYDDISAARTLFPTPPPARLSPDSMQTVQADLDPSTTIEGGEDDSRSNSVGPGTTGSLSANGGPEEGHLGSAWNGKGGEFCHCWDQCSRELKTSVHFGIPSSDVPLTALYVTPVVSSSTNVSATHSQSHYHNALKS